MDHPELDAALDQLYGVPLGDFVKERTRLARDLKQQGNPASAGRVADATKPTLSAWAINIMWRRHRKDVEELFEAGEAVRRATGRDPDDFRAASARQRDAITRLLGRADEILRSAGHAPTAALQRRITITLAALAAAGSFAPERPGQLSADRDPPGFSELAGVAPEPPASTPRLKRVERTEEKPVVSERAPPSAAEAKRHAAAEAKARADAAREEARRAAAEAAAAARDEARRAKAEAAERQKRIAEARKLLASATRAREKAEKDLEARREDVDRARKALDEAVQARADAEAAVARARAEEKAAEDAARA